jgi:hypothetical protein
MASRSLRIRRVLLLAFYSLLLTPLGIGAPTDKANPKSLFDSRRWFELRDSVQRRP